METTLPAETNLSGQSLMRRGFSSGDIIKAVRARRELKPVAEDVDLESEE
jgi:hypothetical protein